MKIKNDKVNTFIHNNSSQLTAGAGLLIMILILSIVSENFFSAKNLINICLQASVIGVLAICETFVIISGGIDLSVGAIVALSSAMMGELVVNRGLNGALGILACLLIGCMCGLINGLLISLLDMPPFVVTLGTMTIFRGLAYEWTNAQAIYGLPDSINFLGQKYIGIIPIAVITVFLLYLISWFIFKHTKFGLYTYSIGGNVVASRLSGIKVKMIKCGIYTLSGILCAIAGIIIAGRMNGTSGLVASGYETDAIAAAAIGGISMAGGKGNIWGTLIGVLVMQCIRNGMNLLGVSSYLQMVVIGSVIIIAVAMDCIRRLRQS
ncbi:ABC transporter permease [Lachnospiraceae bacterium ASD3451]|uniref:ABC transporter permease n=1 Tax=Diplocloster agilis TaxID=2850323 RepID=UPI001DEA1B15|nr:ABC transporter permease [Diplocloster agilis]MBU9744626.1 ABC transporter permease [Diplocloster agilis]